MLLPARISRSCVVLFGVLLAGPHEARSEFPAYRLKVTPMGPQATQPVVIECSRGDVCRGQLELIIDDRRRAVWVVTTVRSLEVFVRFLSETSALFVDQRPYTSIEVDPSGRGEATLTVNVPTSAMLKEADNPLLWNSRPLGRVIATVDVHIEPASR